MKTNIYISIVTWSVLLVSCSTNKQVVCSKYEINQIFQLSPNEKTLDIRENLPDALYIGFFDSEYRDTAYVGQIKNNKLHGVVVKYDRIYRYVKDVTHYKNGKMTGIRRVYLKINDERYENVYLYRRNIRVKELKMEW